MAGRGLKFDQVSVRFCAVSNIFNFDIRHMTPAEIHARAIAHEQDNPDSLEGGPVSAELPPRLDPSNDALDQNPVPDGSKVDFNVSEVPVLDDSAISSGSSNAESSRASARSTAGPHMSPHSPSNASGALLFLVRILLFFNAFISSSFFMFLM